MMCGINKEVPKAQMTKEANSREEWPRRKEQNAQAGLKNGVDLQKHESIARAKLWSKPKHNRGIYIQDSRKKIPGTTL